jgi:WD40 repeat protein
LAHGIQFHGKRLVSGGKVWDAETGNEILTLESGHGFVFSPDGKRLVGTAWRNTTKLWDIQTGQELLSLENAGYPPAFSLEGHRLVSNGPEGTLKFYDATPLPEKP